jgi:thimet oligopeptidase
VRAAADNVIKPLMLAPNYKTNPLVCQSKFLQHCSLDSSVREAAEAAGKAFAAFKAAAKTRQDVYDKVQKYADTPAAAALGPYEAHFVQALVSDFKRGGLALDDAQRAELQRLLDADAACCSKYGSNLGADKTRLTFSVAELEGLPEDFINERKDPNSEEDGPDRPVVLSLKYPDIIPVRPSNTVSPRPAL